MKSWRVKLLVLKKSNFFLFICCFSYLYGHPYAHSFQEKDSILKENSKYQFRVNISPFNLVLTQIDNVWNLGLDLRYLNLKHFDVRLSFFHTHYKYPSSSALIPNFLKTNIISIGVEKEAGKKQRKIKYYYGLNVGYIFTKGQNYLWQNGHSESFEKYLAIGIYNGINFKITPKLNTGIEFSFDGIFGSQLEIIYQTIPKVKIYENRNSLLFEGYSTRPFFLYLTITL